MDTKEIGKLDATENVLDRTCKILAQWVVEERMKQGVPADVNTVMNAAHEQAVAEAANDG